MNRICQSMAPKSFARLGGLLLIIVGLTKAQEDSLRSALNAVDRRQRDLSEYPRYDDDLNEYGYSLNGPDDLAFLSPSEYSTDRDIEKKRLLDYLEDNEKAGYRDDDVKKRISSSFRERLEEDNKERQIGEAVENYLADSEVANDDSDDYGELVKELWEKYENYPVMYNHPRVYLGGEKRSYYPRFGLDSAGLRKRNYYEPGEANAYYYGNPGDDYYDRYQDDYPRHYKRNYRTMKRSPVSKRSSIIHEHKRSTSKKEAAASKTDPKVAQDLSNIFGSVASTEKPTEKPKSNKQQGEVGKLEKKVEEKPSNKAITKEVVGELVDEEPLQIKKKSVDWSDYFGLDRRKKSEDIDNEWLMERYHKAIALGDKRSAVYPLESFKNNDALEKKEAFSNEEQKISEMDAKLKNMEDAIIDDALRYTGAHEGTGDSKEIQEVKDKVIARLATAYSLEKMQRELSEYKLHIRKERERQKQLKLQQQQQQQQQQRMKGDDYEMLEEKRVSVPRKQAVDEEREKTPEGDNHIKCSQGDGNCEEQNYRTPSEVLQQATIEECPKVQRACNDVATNLGHYARVFEAACNMHQMCLLCGNNSWFAPTRQCNVLFLTKAFELCDGKQECRKEAQRSVRYLLEVNRSLRMEPLGECELACPDSR